MVMDALKSPALVGVKLSTKLVLPLAGTVAEAGLMENGADVVILEIVMDTVPELTKGKLMEAVVLTGTLPKLVVVPFLIKS